MKVPVSVIRLPDSYIEFDAVAIVLSSEIMRNPFKSVPFPNTVISSAEIFYFSYSLNNSHLETITPLSIIISLTDVLLKLTWISSQVADYT